MSLIDPVVVDELCDGMRPAYAGRAEVDAAVVRLTRKGHSAAAIGRLLGLNERSVTRIRARAGVGAPGTNQWSHADAVRKATR